MSKDVHFTVKVEGMHCGGCVKRVQGALAKVPGLELDKVEIGTATGTFDPDEADGAAVLAALKAIGYDARLEGAASA